MARDLTIETTPLDTAMFNHRTTKLWKPNTYPTALQCGHMTAINSNLILSVSLIIRHKKHFVYD